MPYMQRTLNQIVAEIQRDFNRSGLTQSQYAARAGVSQATVSRLLSSDRFRGRMSSGIRALCSYAGISLVSEQAKDVRTQEQLLSALESVWDGTESHAHALTRFLVELARVSRRSDA